VKTIFDALRKDHDQQRKLVKDLLETEGESSERESLFDQLEAQLAAHAAAEERFFYVPLMQVDMTQENARHSVAEHKELDDLVEQLNGYDMSSSQWLITARELAERLEHHLDEEEVEVFPVAGKALSEEDKITLAASYSADMERHLAMVTS